MNENTLRTIQDIHGELDAPDLGVQAYGMEVELERVTDVPQYVRGTWRLEHDGSLRHNGMEFLTPPIDLGGLHDMLDNLYRGKQVKGWTGGTRCGIHLHMDFTEKTVQHLGAFMAAYICLEPAIMTLLCGEEREQNIYCVPYYRAPGDLTRIAKFLRTGDERVLHSLGRTCKYSALYLEPLLRFGTVEFRGAPVYEDVASTLRLVTTFDTILKETKGADMVEVIDAFEDDTRAALRTMAPDLPAERTEELMMATDSTGLAAQYLVRTKPQELDWNTDLPHPEPLELLRRAQRVQARNNEYVRVQRR